MSKPQPPTRNPTNPLIAPNTTTKGKKYEACKKSSNNEDEQSVVEYDAGDCKSKQVQKNI